MTEPSRGREALYRPDPPSLTTESHLSDGVRRYLVQSEVLWWEAPDR